MDGNPNNAIISQEDSLEFVQALEDAGFNLKAWDFLKELASEMDLSPEDAKTYEEYTRIIEKVTDFHKISDK